MFNQLGVIGCGLMGGSFALALKRAGLVQHVVGYSKSPTTTELAKRMGVIDVAAESALLFVEDVAEGRIADGTNGGERIASAYNVSVMTCGVRPLTESNTRRG